MPSILQPAYCPCVSQLRSARAAAGVVSEKRGEQKRWEHTRKQQQQQHGAATGAGAVCVCVGGGTGVPEEARGVGPEHLVGHGASLSLSAHLH